MMLIKDPIPVEDVMYSVNKYQIFLVQKLSSSTLWSSGE